MKVGTLKSSPRPTSTWRYRLQLDSTVECASRALLEVLDGCNTLHESKQLRVMVRWPPR